MYCNYSKDKFDNGITFIKPYWLDTGKVDIKNLDYHNPYWLDSLPVHSINEGDFMAFMQRLHIIESTYMEMVSDRYKPQEAREILPLCTKSELIMTGFKSDWDHFFDLRLYGKTGEPHPDMKILAQKIKDEFDKYNL